MRCIHPPDGEEDVEEEEEDAKDDGDAAFPLDNAGDWDGSKAIRRLLRLTRGGGDG